MLETARFRFGFISRSRELYDRVRQCMHHESDCDILYEEIYHGEEARGVEKLFAQGAECIVAYSGSAQAISHVINHSVAIIERTDMDIIEGLLYAKQFTDRVAFCSCLDEFRDVENMQAILGMDLRLVHYANTKEMFDKIAQAYNDGYKLLLGGGLARSHMVSLGGRGIPLMPSPYNIYKAFQQARAIALQKREAESHKSRLLAILGKLDDGVICVDSECRPVFSNSKAYSLLQLSESAPFDALLEHLDSFRVSEILQNGAPSAENIIIRGNAKILVSTLALPLGAQQPGALVLLRDISAIQNMDRKIRASLYTRGFVSRYTLKDIEGTSAAVRQLKSTVKSFAAYNASVHIAGETGSGKELVAHALHAESERKNHPFVSVNCSALPETLLESELFGYEEGAFTGAKRGGKLGLFELANKGTLFLDEIGEISPTVQLRLLRVLEAREVMRVGGDRIVPIDVRIISASNVPLQDLVQNGQFRADLYFRLIVLHVQIPPLRKRLQDVPVLLRKLLPAYGKDAAYLTPDLLKAIGEYAWPGNVRELLSVMESHLILDGNKTANPVLFKELLAKRSLHNSPAYPESGLAPYSGGGRKAGDKWGRAKIPVILEALRENNGNRSAAARQLGISYSTVWRLLRTVPGRPSPEHSD